MRLGPYPEAKPPCGPQLAGEQVRPVGVSWRPWRQIDKEIGQGRALIALRETYKSVGIGDSPSYSSPCVGSELQQKHLGPSGVEAVEMALPGLVQQHIARFHPVASGVAGLEISTREHHCRKGWLMQMTRQLLARQVPQAAGCQRSDAARGR